MRPHGTPASDESKDRYYGYRVKVDVYSDGSHKVNSTKKFTSHKGADAPPPPADVPVGEPGALEFLAEDDLTWLSPAAARLALSFINDAYLEGHLNAAADEITRLLAHLDEAASAPGWDALPEADRDDLEQIRDDLWTLQHRIGSNLDYFGNPAGWVPMLSFEVNKLAFDHEIDRAIRVMYLHHWLGRRATDAADAAEAMRQMRDELLAQVDADRETFDQVVREIPAVESDAATLQNEIDGVLLDIQAIEDQLLPKAKRIAVLKKTARALGKIAQTIPVYQPALGAAGGAVAASADIDPDKSWEENAILVGEGTAGGFVAGKTLSKAQSAQSAAAGINTGDAEADNSAAAAALRDARDPLLGLLQETYDSATASKSSDPEVAAELERLLADVPEFRVLQNRLDSLNVRKREFIGRLANLNQQVTVLPIAISRNLRTVDLLSTEIREANRRLDPATLAYLDDMNRRAQARLLKYHYYVAKAYAYRRLEAYPGRLDLNRLFTEFESLASSPENRELDADEFESLKSIYQGQISDVAEAILDDINQDPPEQSIVALVPLPERVIDAINAGEQPRINLADFDLFPDAEENLRITDLVVSAMDVAHTPGTPAPSSVDLVVQHSGVSRLKKDGETYQFRHDNDDTRSLIQWKTRYLFADGTLAPSRPSKASQSLIAALVPDAANVLKYSRPAADADLVLSLDSSASPTSEVALRNATLRVEYDFTQRNRFLRTLEVLGGDDGTDVQVDIDTTDQNGRSTGRGGFERTYDANSTITLIAPESVGDLQFIRWEGAGLTDPTRREQTVTLTDNLTLQPVYEPATTYTIAVTGGSGGGVYHAGDIAEITADAPAPGHRFVRWSGGSPADPDSPTTTLPVTGDTTVTAEYAPATSPGNSGLLTILPASEPGSVELLLAAPEDGAWTIQASDDATTWSAIADVTVTDGLASLTVAVDRTTRLFRATQSR